MRIDIISCVPELLHSPISYSIISRAIKKRIIDIYIHDLRECGIGKHKKIDDYPYGGASGMVLRIEPIDKCLTKLKSERNYDTIIYMSPDGEAFNQNLANELSLLKNIIILCGHYKGIDERIRENFIDREISIGKYVLSGGEIPALVCIDAIIRLIPNVLGDETSALSDSFQDGLVAPPIYTRPAHYQGYSVPDVLRSGNTKKINEWEYKKQLERTKKRTEKK